MELALIALLHTQLANVFGTPVVGRSVLFLFQPLLVTLVDAPDVANHMAGQLAVRVLAEQSGLDFHTREPVALRTEAGHLFVGQAIANRQRVKTLGLLTQALEAATVLGLDVHQLGQLIDGGLHVLDLRGRDLQGVGRIVAREHNAVAIQNRAPGWHGGQDGCSVVFGLRHQIVVTNHLQISQTAGQQQKATQDHPLHDLHPVLEAQNFGAGVAQLRQ